MYQNGHPTPAIAMATVMSIVQFVHYYMIHKQYKVFFKALVDVSCVRGSFSWVKLSCYHGNDMCEMTVFGSLPHISGSKGFQKKLLVPEVVQFIEAYSV